MVCQFKKGQFIFWDIDSVVTYICTFFQVFDLIWLYISDYEVQAVQQYKANLMTASNILHPGREWIIW